MMKYSKQIHINKKRIKKEDLLQISKIVMDEFSDEYSDRKFKVNFWDDSSITGDSEDVFNNSYFERKRSKEIVIECFNRGLSNYIRIDLCDSYYLDKSSITVDSDDSYWYNAMVSRFTEFIEETESQNILCIVGNHLFSSVILFVIGYPLSYCSGILIDEMLKNYNIVLSVFLNYLVVIFIVLLNFALSWYLINFLKKAFPSVEFCFGPEHMNSGLKIRKTIMWLIATFSPSIILYALSLILELISDTL